jgi:cell fate regulator YaaT (PSP1 superfamily)
MACTSCATTDGGAPKGCRNNGTCGTDSCNKLTVFDWLSNMSLPNGEAPFDCVEIRFKNGRKEFYRNTEKLTLSIGDVVATEASPGHDIGIITLTGELVKVQMKKKKVSLTSPDIAKIYRKASQKDIDVWSSARDKEEVMKVRARELAIEQKLEMKISDIENQGDGSKSTFYYTANDRVDFRNLIKEFARVFSTRIEMKQVGLRQEASRLGGIGSCGRELCCSTWLTDFRSVNTSAARYQQLSLNPQKLAGQCGKLKCCLNFELDTYMDALKDFPAFETKLVTEKGDAICQKQDIFKGLMWFAYTNNFAEWHVLKIEQVREIIEENKLKNKVSSLEDFALEIIAEPKKDFNNAMGQESLTRFDQPKRTNKNKKKKPAGANLIVSNNKQNPNDSSQDKQNKQKGSNVIVANKNQETTITAEIRPNQEQINKANANNPNFKGNNNRSKNNNKNRNKNKQNSNKENTTQSNEPRVSNKIIPNKKNEPNE